MIHPDLSPSHRMSRRHRRRYLAQAPVVAAHAVPIRVWAVVVGARLLCGLALASDSARGGLIQNVERAQPFRWLTPAIPLLSSEICRCERQQRATLELKVVGTIEACARDKSCSNTYRLPLPAPVGTSLTRSRSFFAWILFFTLPKAQAPNWLSVETTSTVGGDPGITQHS